MSHLFAESNPLSAFRWDHRIILITAATSEMDMLVKELHAEKAAIEDRHILWFVLSDDSVATNYAKELPGDFRRDIKSRYFDSSVSGIRVLLIGKDGGLKSLEEKLDLVALYERIDSMPMRRQEMKVQ